MKGLLDCWILAVKIQILYPLIWVALQGRLCLAMELLSFRHVEIQVRDPLYHIRTSEVAVRYLGGEQTETSVPQLSR